VFDTYCLSGRHRLKVKPILLMVDYGGMWISTARGRLTPEVTSPIDRATTVFYSCFVDTYRLSCTVSTLFVLLLSAKTAERRFRPLGGVRPEVKSPFDSMTPIGIGRFWNFSISFYLSKGIQLQFACRMLFEILGKGYCPVKNFFHR
jgi:hypothetical protein